MDITRFDRLTRELATATSRRGMLKLLAGAALALGATAVRVPSLRAATCVGVFEACTADGDCCGRFTCQDDGTCGGPSAGCVAAGEECANESCCQGFYCNDAGVCAGAAECAGDGGGCDADEACCGRLTCQDDGTCGGPSAGPECADDSECATDKICCGGVCAAIACCIEDDDPNARCPEGTACFEGYCDPVGGETGGTTALPATGAGARGGGTTGWLLGAAAIGGVAAAGAVRLRASSDEAS